MATMNTKKNNANTRNNSSLGTNKSLVSITNNSSTFQTAKEEAGVYEVVSENYLLLIGFSAAIVLIIIIYLFSQTFRVGRAMDKMLVYQGFQNLLSLEYSKIGDKRLGDFYVASSYNASHCGYQMFDYTSEKIVLSVLQSGARYIEFNVFNSEFGPNAYPVVSMGYKVGEWKMMISDTPLETIFETIAKNAFSIYDGVNGVNNLEDPIFIGLNLNTNSNMSCLNLIAFLITKYFGPLLLPSTYSFQNSDELADITMNQAMGKVVIFASDGFQGSGLEELVNYSWDNVDNNPKHAMQRLLYSDLTSKGFDTNGLIEYNRTGLTIIVPHKEGDFLNYNYNPTLAFELGCQFISMEYQTVDSNMDIYITKFKDSSFLMKNQDLQKGKTNIKKTKTTVAQSKNSYNSYISKALSTATSTVPKINARAGF